MSIADGPFGAPARESGAHPVPPPFPLLVAGVVVLVASVALIPFNRFSDWAHVLGWILASFGCIGAMSAFTATDLKRRQSAWYSPRPAAGLVRTSICVIAVIIGGAHAWILAWSLASR